MNNKYSILKEKLNILDIRYLENEPMKKHTTFGIGGPVDLFILPSNNSQITDVIKIIYKAKTDFYFLGSGSNILVKDKGINGVVLSLKKSSKNIIFNKLDVEVDCGVMLGTLVKELNKRDIKGYESLIGVPGTVGGALFMNAGAYGSEISNNLISVRAINIKGKIKHYKSKDIVFSYRDSTFSTKEILLNAKFKCIKGNKKTIIANKEKASLSRREKQPLKYRSAGSIFKNPINNLPAGLLIDKTGLKGMKIGDAQISEKHGNFIINLKNAKSKEVIKLINIIKKKVNEKFNIKLELEIKILGN